MVSLRPTSIPNEPQCEPHFEPAHVPGTHLGTSPKRLTHCQPVMLQHNEPDISKDRRRIAGSCYAESITYLNSKLRDDESTARINDASGQSVIRT